jgi:RNA polymerase sigma-70 factor (ECF subfamily)
MTVRDEQLIQGVVEGDKVAFGILVERYRKQVLGMCYSFTKDYHDTEDIAQTVFVKAYKSISNLDDPERFPAWLSKITYSTCKDWLRREKRETLTLKKLEGSGLLRSSVTESIRAEEDLDKIVAAALTELPENMQVVLSLRFYEKLSYRDIADFLDVPVSTVRGMLYRGTQLLRKLLAAYLKK